MYSILRIAITIARGYDNLGELFWLLFSETARYLGIRYLGHAHTIVGNNETENLKKFIKHANSGTLQ
jgi:hypothetical protein